MRETDVVTGEVRLSYCHLTKAYAQDKNSEPKYSTTILVPKTDTATMGAIKAAIEAAKRAGLDKCWSGVMPPICAVPVYDGDGVRPSDGMPFGAECKGHYVFTASTKESMGAPEVVGTDNAPIANPTQIYSGMYARVMVSFYPYNSNGKKGVGCGLGPVQKLGDGEPLGGSTPSASAVFGQAASVFGQPAGEQLPFSQPTYAQPAGNINPITGMPM